MVYNKEADTYLPCWKENDYGFQRFLLRGKTKVKLEILLLCLGYNRNKLHANIQNDRTGSHLFEIKSV